MAQDQGITSPVHQKYVNQIVFAKSKNDLAFKNENPSKFTNSFSTSDNIYGRVYLDKSIKNKISSYAPGVLFYELYIDGQRIGHKKSFGMYKHLEDPSYYTEQMNGGDPFFKWTSWKVWLLPTLDDNEIQYGNVNIAARAFTLALLDQEPGKHEVQLKIINVSMDGTGQNDFLAEGSFVIDIKAADKNKLAFAYAPPLPKDEYTGPNKSETLAAIKTAFEEEVNKTPIIWGIYKQGWKEGTYTLTGQKYKKIAGWAVFPDTNGDGQVPITTFNFISDYSNGGWTKLRFDSHCLGCPDWDVEIAAAKAAGEG